MQPELGRSECDEHDGPAHHPSEDRHGCAEDEHRQSDQVRRRGQGATGPGVGDQGAGHDRDRRECCARTDPGGRVRARGHGHHHALPIRWPTPRQSRARSWGDTRMPAAHERAVICPGPRRSSEGDPVNEPDDEQAPAEVLSLTQVEAEERAALIDVRRYDISVDMTDLLTGTDLRCVSTITFTSRDPGTPTFVDCAATVVSARLNDLELPPAARAGSARGPRRGEHAGRRDACSRRRSTARVCTGRSTRRTRRSTSGPPSSPTRPAMSGPASTSPTSRHRTRSPSPRRRPGGGQQLR